MYIVKNEHENVQFNNKIEAIKYALTKNNSKVFHLDEPIFDTSIDTNKIYFNNEEFVIDTKHKRYKNIPIKYYDKLNKTNDLEYHSGAYNYLYSKPGYETISVDISLVEAIYKPSQNSTKYQGYILVNHQSTDQLDVGLSIFYENDEVFLKPFYYYMGGGHPKDFFVDNIIISKFNKVDHNTFKGFDKLTIELTKRTSGWCFKIINKNTNHIYLKMLDYPNAHTLKDINRFLIGVSLVPVKDLLWDPLCKAELSNVIFENVVMNHKDELYPLSSTMEIGYSQGHPFATYEIMQKVFKFTTKYI
ncbi:hypothetical protein [Acholeplasma granularum]|uniref:hypothetical protein n=1 Tax=Acholeplasma granularum TaxID=264635 RepID=UPI000472E37F|nr:hypothetical protein [Acholeplasma granularum]